MADQKYILVIDDDVDFLDYVEIVLLAGGYRVRTATSANEGLEMMRQEPPDLVMLDMMMSYVLDGCAVGREMHLDPNLRDVPVMMVSAIVSSEEEGLLLCSEMERVDTFMSKPIEPPMLLSRVAELIQPSQRSRGKK